MTGPFAPPLLSSPDEARVFLRLRLRIALSTLTGMLRTARLRMSLVVCLSAFFWFGLYFLFREGFEFLASRHAEIVQPLYNAFFASLMLMLAFSSGIILYGGLYRSPETAFLLTTPARTERIFHHKFQEALWFSSWGFVLLGSPMLVAYGLVAEAPWYYYALLAPFMLAFIHIPAAIGAIVCLVVADRLSKIRLHTIALAGLLVLVLAAWLGWSLLSGTEGDLMTPRWFQEMSDRLRFAEVRLLPSWWLSSGLLEATLRSEADHLDYQPWAESLLFLALLVSNALFLHLVAAWVARRTYRISFSRMHCERPSRRRTRVHWFDRAFTHGAVVLPWPIRLLLVKDFRLFRRDPVQWSQLLIFFGLLALYFFNIRRFSYNLNYSSMIGFLNLAVVGLILSTFTTRFVFPMISLEGRRFWILGRLPVDREAIIWSKFIFAAAGSLLPCAVLILLSDLMLDITLLMLVAHQVSCVALCLGLSGIAVGLGAQMPDLREDSPSKIAAGFGGTLNLVVSAIYIVVVVLLTAVPFHIWLAAEQGLLNGGDEPLSPFIGGYLGIGLGVLLTCVVGAVATVWPIRAGLRAFRKLEF